eukprot:TRINITY_DN269_c0_g1_i1.p1 TRINITY_DN269_c0_g1~~TRINITY_DN269_c0_g1_i1.p1  ORF type:complete len:176 (-),score=50.85 TRINITY_DN269_c0_g1_i1:20-547(-)
MAMNTNGTRLATASENGTLIRIWDTSTGDKLQELRRGSSPAEIYCINFNFDTTMICVSGSTGTVHLFALNESAQEGAKFSKSSDNSENTNMSSWLGGMTSILPDYFSSEWSFWRLKQLDTSCITAFGPEQNSIVVASETGKFYKAEFDPSVAEELDPSDNDNWAKYVTESAFDEK